MNKNQQLLLNEIIAGTQPEQIIVKSFNELSQKTNMTKSEVDDLLEEFEKERYITQFVVEGIDAFKVRIHAKAFTI